MIRLSKTPAAALSLLGASAALAQEHGASHEAVSAIPTVEQGLVTGITALIVFGIVFAVLAWKVWPVIGKGLDERAGKIRAEIAAAEAARKQAKEALEQYERSLGEARAEAQRMLEQARAQQLTLANELKTKAEAELGALKERARKDIEAAKRAAVSEIYEKAAEAATAIASKILQRELTASDQRRITLEAVSELEATQG